MKFDPPEHLLQTSVPKPFVKGEASLYISCLHCSNHVLNSLDTQAYQWYFLSMQGPHFFQFVTHLRN